ncbi:nectin-4 isoform X2 [Nothobranchius furzeri]|uniref:Transcript variant X2 n=1 Tax=Nothobranchius furzeri TaxID=105023 RepID=A0A9D3BTI0_NOTFU|nr:nectin-4 isoform X2 [Nothobranchius furzeri]KAF7221992.1 transcript variant X2 [Nothobranchius furzeri]
MDLISTRVVLTLLLITVASVQGDFLEPVEPDVTQHSMTETQTRLPCHYEVKEGEQVVQVTWNKILPNGDKDLIIMAHFTDGLTAFGRYSGRVKFENNVPTRNSALLILKTEVSDEGSYNCKISTFPRGNFERNINLEVWSAPISEVVPETLVEDQPHGLVATCRATGRPAPILSWDTDLQGESQFLVSGSGTVSSQFSLKPLRSMNGKKLDCLVSHPSLEKPRRISHNLVVQYPPDPSISSPFVLWQSGMEKAELMCEDKGNPEPLSITWKRKGGELPDGVSMTGKKLTFDRALRLNDSGAYECEVTNAVGTRKTTYVISVITGTPDNMLVIIIGAAAGAAVLMLIVVVLLVRRHHRKTTKRLQCELKEKTDEINNLSRQSSFRRLYSYSSNTRMPDEESDSLRISNRNGNIRVSSRNFSKKGSMPILDDDIERDNLGRPIIGLDEGESVASEDMGSEMDYHRRKIEAHRMNAYGIETVLKESNASVDSGHPASLDPPKAQQDDHIGPRGLDLGHMVGGDSPYLGERYGNGNVQISKCMSDHFYYSNGSLRPKPHNGILMSPKPTII